MGCGMGSRYGFGAHREVSECTGKEPLDRALAEKIAKRASRNHEEKMIAYRCRQCGRWHVGNNKPKRRKIGQTTATKGRARDRLREEIENG